MRKISEVLKQKAINENKKEVDIIDILKHTLLIESDSNEDITDQNLEIVGLEDASAKIKEFIQEYVLKEQLKICEHIYTHFRSGQFKYLDSLMESIQNKMSSEDNE